MGGLRKDNDSFLEFSGTRNFDAMVFILKKNMGKTSDFTFSDSKLPV